MLSLHIHSACILGWLEKKRQVHGIEGFGFPDCVVGSLSKWELPFLSHNHSSGKSWWCTCRKEAIPLSTCRQERTHARRTILPHRWMRVGPKSLSASSSPDMERWLTREIKSSYCGGISIVKDIASTRGDHRCKISGFHQIELSMLMCCFYVRWTASVEKLHAGERGSSQKAWITVSFSVRIVMNLRLLYIVVEKQSMFSWGGSNRVMLCIKNVHLWKWGD